MCELLLILLPGALGGCVQWLSNLVQELKLEDKVARAKDIAPVPMFTQALVGCGGALATTLVLLAVGKFPEAPLNLEDWLFLVSLSFVAGFIGHRLLPIVAARLEQQIAESKRASKEAKEASQQARQVAEQATKDVGKGRAVDEAVDATFIALQKADSENEDLPAERIQTYIQYLENLSKQEPTKRKLHIMLGRLYRKLGSYDEAIGALSRFIEAKTAAGQGSDEHTAAALYNRACYRSQESTHKEGREAYELREEAVEDLRKAVTLSPQTATEAKTDDDFDPLKGDEAFRTLVAAA